MKNGLFAAAAIAAFGLTMTAGASTISYKILDGSTQIGSGSTDSGSVMESVAGKDAFFKIGLNVSGPANMAPNFSTNDFTVSRTTMGTPSTLYIYVTNTGLTSAPGIVNNTFTTNALASTDFTGDTISNYFDASNTAYGMGTLLGTTTFTGAGGFAGPMSAYLNPVGPYSETTVYMLNFAASTKSDSVSASSQIVGVAATPEPSSLMLLGTGLFGAAGTVLRRRRQAAL